MKFASAFDADGRLHDAKSIANIRHAIVALIPLAINEDLIVVLSVIIFVFIYYSTFASAKVDDSKGF